MDTSIPSKWHHLQAEMILLCVRWYPRYLLSYRDLEEMEEVFNGNQEK
jgi:IS6 family transposase